MKTIIYLLIAVFIISIASTSFIKQENSKTQFFLQATQKNNSSESLLQSAEIITERLKTFSDEIFEVKTIPKKNQIKVILNESWNLQMTKNLISKKGVLSFYETYNLKSSDNLLNADQNIFLKGSDIESMNYGQDEFSEHRFINIQFKESAIEIWKNATQRNMGHAIAIVLDNEVIAAPVVNSIIDYGNCQITGNFTSDEIKYIVAIGNNGELPLEFELVK